MLCICLVDSVADGKRDLGIRFFDEGLSVFRATTMARSHVSVCRVKVSTALRAMDELKGNDGGVLSELSMKSLQRPTALQSKKLCVILLLTKSIPTFVSAPTSFS